MTKTKLNNLTNKIMSNDYQPGYKKQRDAIKSTTAINRQIIRECFHITLHPGVRLRSQLELPRAFPKHHRLAGATLMTREYVAMVLLLLRHGTGCCLIRHSFTLLSTVMSFTSTTKVYSSLMYNFLKKCVISEYYVRCSYQS